MLKYKNVSLRKAQVDDALQLSSWWNDGEIMAHAGFPNGVGVSVGEIVTLIKKNSDNRCLFILDVDGTSVGEMHYRKKGSVTSEIGIKICDKTFHNKGIGKKALSLLIHHLFDEHKCETVLVDVAAKNKMAQHVYEQVGFKPMNNTGCVTKKYKNRDTGSIKYELRNDEFVSYLK